MKQFYFKLIVLFSIGALFIEDTNAQKEDSSFDSIYVHAATTMAALDNQKAIHVADSLYRHSENSVQKMKSLMLIATLKGYAGDKVEALSHAIQAEEIARKDKSYDWQIRIAGFLSTTFRERNLTEEGEKYLHIAEEAVKRLSRDTPGLSTIQALMHQEKAYYRIAEENYKAAIEELEKAEVEFLKTKESRRSKVFLATNYQLFGACLTALNEYEPAREKLALALEELGEEESGLKAFIYTDFAEIEMHYGNYDAALELYKKAEVYIATSDNFNIKSSLFKGLSSYYKAVGDQTEAIRYNELYTDYIKAFSKSTKEISDQLIRQLRLEKERTVKKNVLLIGTSLFLVMLLVCIVLYFRTTQKIERMRYEDIIVKMEASESSVEKAKGSSIQKRNTRESLVMPKETEERILNKLKQWEESNGFLNKDLSLSALAFEFNTNSKYLSSVINTHKEKDFNNYVNELKILFVIDKLRNSPEYLEYKLSYIAEEFGFSSHSKFASVFKSFVGLSPSVFISHLKKDRLESV